jgi:diguanylate cyclase (GGDEF)-like protein
MATFIHPIFRQWQRTFVRWQIEHKLVEQEAISLNLQRVRLLGLVVATLNALHAVVFAVQLIQGSASEAIADWKLALLLAHLGMGVTMGVCSYSAYHLRYASKSLLGKWSPVLLIWAGMLFVIAITAIDQWVTPNITPFLIGCLGVSMAMLLRPTNAALFYLSAYAVFFYAMGLTQTNPEMLLSNRFNGLAAVAMGWALSMLLWRNFTTITLQHAELEKTNADLQAKQKDLQRLTRLDGLTALFNRSTFLELAKQELARARRQSTPTVVLMLDLDHFKHINDTWGHPAGDAVLRHVAALATDTVRSTDLVGRLGGEEFMVLLPNTTVEAARKLAEKLRARLEATPTACNGTVIAATVSIGLACTTALENHDFDHLYTSADKALYLAKQRGRNRVV